MTTDSRTSLRPEVVDRIAGLELKARHIVEGYVSGLHRSPFRGFSVEFAEHREYVPGDDVRFLDWKVFGKTDRLYIKRYEEETNLEAWMVVDISGSMAYDDREAKLPSKLAYSTWGAAALAWLITRQRDAAGLVLFDDRIRLTLPAQANEAHLRRELEALSTTVTETRAALEIATERYYQGALDITQVLQTRRQLFSAQGAQLATRLALLNSRVDLYSALGGGFDASSVIENGANDETP